MIIESVNKEPTLPEDTLNTQITAILPGDLPKIIELRPKVSEAQEKLSSRIESVVESESSIEEYEPRRLMSILAIYSQRKDWLKKITSMSQKLRIIFRQG